MLSKKPIAALLLSVWLSCAGLNAFALTTITANTTWTPGSIPTAGVTWDAANQQFVLTDSLTINSNRTLSIQNGSNGGNFLLTLPNAGSLILNSGAIIDLSGVSGNGNGGNFTTNLAGSTGTINISGTVRSNGIGSGNGGIITLNGTTFTLASGGLIEALGGTSGTGGYGGAITLNKTNTGRLSIPSGFTIQTNGLSSATQNLITIAADDILVDTTVNANGISNGAGGKIILTADNGRVSVGSSGLLNATGNGTGTGGTMEFYGHEAGQLVDIDNCSNNSCSGGSDIETFTFHNNARMNVAGGSANNGTFKFGRAGAGDLNITMGKITASMLRGASRVELGNDGGYTANNTISGYSRTSDFNGTNPVLAFYATNNITGTSSNNFSAVEARNTSGTISITGSTGALTVNTLTGTGTATLKAPNATALTLANSTFAGTVNLQTDGSITATSGNAMTGTINLSGQSGAGTKAGAISLTNAAATTIGGVEGASATLTSTGAASDMTIANANITNAATLTSGRDITANDTNNNFGTTTAASGRNITLRDSMGNFTLNNITATGTLDVTALVGSDISISNADVTGAATITGGGAGSNISGTGNTFRSTANINTNDTLAGDINLSGDFQGNTSLSGTQVAVTDTAGNLTVTSYTQGVTNSTLTSNNGSVTATITDLNNGGAGRLTITARDNISVTGTGWTDTADTLVANSTNVGAFTLTGGTVSKITGRSVAQTGPSSGIWVGANSGTYTFNGVTSNGNVDITGAGNITLGTTTDPMSIGGATTFASSGDVTGTSTFTGAVSGSANRIGLVSTGNFTSAGLTANGNTGWPGDETLIVQTRSGDILGSGYTASGLGNLRLQAGAWNYQNTGNAVSVTNVSAAQNAAFYATGANAGTSISVGGTSNVAGHITATGINTANNFAATTGGIDLTMSSGNLKTALLWSNNGTVNLTANNGNILQDTSVYSGVSTGVAGGKTIWGSGPINLTAQGSASRYIDTGVMALTTSGTGGNITAKAQGDSAGNGTGVSVNLRGRADGNVTVTNLASGNTTGDVYLGTSVGPSTTNLEDSPATVMDVMGTTTIKSAGHVKMYGSFNGPISVTGKTLTGTSDRGNLNFTNVTTTATSGTGINMTALQGSLTGGNLSTAGTANIFLQAGSVLPRDSRTNINLTNVTAGGNLDVVVAGSTNGNASGQSVVITGSKGGTSSATSPGGGAPLGSVSMP
ncbi:MAG TPA: hypothetical protein V6C52_01865 [Coleofasciculaceae cyanobacterium]|jgi:hypothetical protein